MRKLKWFLLCGFLFIALPARAQAHSATLTWTESTTCASPCTITFNVFRGTSPGGESSTPLNASPLTVMSYVDTVTLGSSAQTFYYTVKAVETSGSIVQTSAPSTEVSGTFPSSTIAAPTVTITVQ